MGSIADKHEELYHYTNWEGLRGIISEQCFHASHIQFLNDHSEYLHAKPVIIERVTSLLLPEVKSLALVDKELEKRIADLGGTELFCTKASSDYIDCIYDILGSGFYVVSFVGSTTDSYIQANGLLSQWRGYGGGQGFALVFETGSLEKMFVQEWNKFRYEVASFHDMVYGPDDPMYASDISPKLDEVARSVVRRIRHVAQTRNISEEIWSLNDFCQIATALKHPGFREENEVRGVFLPFASNHRQFFLRMGKIPPNDLRAPKQEKLKYQNGNPKPYIDLLGPEIGQLPVKRIIVGPGLNSRKYAEAVRVLLDDANIKIDVSETPFV